jgi:hypothetical protein
MSSTTTTAVTRPGTRRPLRAVVLAVLAALVAVIAPVATATSASAYGSYYGDGGYNGGYDGGYNGGYNGGTSGGYTGTVYVTPVLNCVISGSNGAYTAVLGYKNTSSSQTFTITGDYNVITPSSYDGGQPTVFKPGTYPGVFKLQVSYGTVYWSLAGTKLTISRTAASACPPSTQMPADGNGTGVVVALAIAAGLGVLIVNRARRRAAVPTPEQETVDA